MPRPCALSATTTCSAFAVAQKTRQTSGQSLIRFSTLIGIRVPQVEHEDVAGRDGARRLDRRRERRASSFPSLRIRQAPDASLNARPNRACGTDGDHDLVEILDRLDEVALPDDDVAPVGHPNRNHLELHGCLPPGGKPAHSGSNRAVKCRSTLGALTMR